MNVLACIEKLRPKIFCWYTYECNALLKEPYIKTKSKRVV